MERAVIAIDYLLDRPLKQNTTSPKIPRPSLTLKDAKNGGDTTLAPELFPSFQNISVRTL